MITPETRRAERKVFVSREIPTNKKILHDEYIKLTKKQILPSVPSVPVVNPTFLRLQPVDLLRPYGLLADPVDQGVQVLDRHVHTPQTPDHTDQ